MNDRLLKLLESEQLSSSKFADVIGVQRSSVSHILSGRNKPSYDFLHKILTAFPYVSADWLLVGEGTMYKGEEITPGGSLFDQPTYNSDNEGINIITGPQKEIPDQPENMNIPPSESNISEVTGNRSEKVSPQSVEDDNKDNSDAAFDKAPQNEIENNSKGKSSRTIRRVLIFYSDNTFESYSESN